MAKLFYVHWNEEEAQPVIRSLRRAGHSVEWECADGAEAWRRLRAEPPDALVVSLDRLPSHGRRTAAIVHEKKELRGLPVVFVGGEPEKVKVAREEFPEATFTGSGELESVLERVVARSGSGSP